MQIGEGINPAVLKRTAGYILKKGGTVNSTAGRRNWKKRWFVIETKEYETFIGYEFKYFDAPNGKLKGSIDLTNVEVFCEDKPKLGIKNKFDFHLLLPNGSSLKLSCEDYKEREEWLETLNMVIAYSRKMIRASANSLDGWDPMYEDEEQIYNVGSAIAHNCQAFGPGLFGAEAGQHAQFVIQTHDLMGNPLVFGGLPLTATLEDNECTYYLRINDNNDGTYSAYYVISRPGIYKLFIRLNDEHEIYGSPFEVDILPSKTIPERCTAVGEALMRVHPGIDCQFTITSRDNFGNQKRKGGDAFEVGVMGPAQLKSLKDNDDGSYLCTFVAQPPNELNFYAAASLMIQVTLNGKHIYGSPFRPTIEDPLPDKIKPIANTANTKKGVLDIRSMLPKNNFMTTIQENSETETIITETDELESIFTLTNNNVPKFKSPVNKVLGSLSAIKSFKREPDEYSESPESVASHSVATASTDSRFEKGQRRMSKLEELSNRVSKLKSSKQQLASINASKGASLPVPSSPNIPKHNIVAVQQLIVALQDGRQSAGGIGLPNQIDSTNSNEQTIWRITSKALQNDEVKIIIYNNYTEI